MREHEVDDAEQPVRVHADPLHPLEAAEAPLTGFLDDLPRHALLAIVLRRHRPDHLDREAVTQVAPFDLLVTQPKVHPSSSSP